MTVTYKPLKKGTKVRLRDRLGLAQTTAWGKVTGTIDAAFIGDEGIMYAIRLDKPAIHDCGVLLHVMTAHADNILEIA